MCIIFWKKDLFERYFFELSADIKDELEIYCMDNNTFDGKVVSKEEFLEKMRAYSLQKCQWIVVDA